MSPLEFLNLAKDLARIDKPAELRTALGRAYYAIYNAGIEYQKSHGLKVWEGDEGGKNHSLVRDRFGDVMTDSVQDLYRDMYDLHKMRKLADYVLANKDVENKTNVQTYITMAEDAIRFLEEIATSVNTDKIVEEMQDWEARNPGKTPK